MQDLFELGQLVKPVGSNDSEAGEILAINITPDGVNYKVSGTEIDVRNKKLIQGIRHFEAKELELIKPNNNETEQQE